MKRYPWVKTSILFVNTYSILVALGSFSSYLFFCKIYNVMPHPVISIGLSLCVWFIYTLDHLLDGQALQQNATSNRHKTHYQNQKILVFLLVLVVMVIASCALRVPRCYYPFVGALLGLTTVHFLVNYTLPSRVKKTIFLKEIFIALVVTIGFVVTPTVCEKYLHIKPFITSSFFLLNLSNLVIFSFFDKEDDQQAGFMSIAHFYSMTTIRRVIYTCLLISALLAGVSFVCLEITQNQWAVIFLMQAVLAMVALFPDTFAQSEKYRFWGDFIYLIPLPFLPFL